MAEGRPADAADVRTSQSGDRVTEGPTRQPAAPPKLLLLTKGLGMGGAERLLVNQAVALRDVADITVAFTRADKTHYVGALEDAGVEVHLLGSGSSVSWPMDLARLMRRIRPDIVHAHSPIVGSIGRLMARLGWAEPRSVTVSTEHNTWDAYRFPTKVLNRLTLPLDRAVWTVSQEAKDGLPSARLRRRARAVTYGIDVAGTIRAADEVSPPGLPEPVAGRFTFVHVANLRPVKAHEVLLEAFSIASARDPRLHLWLVGQGVTYEALERLHGDIDRERVVPLGMRSDVPAIMRRADAFAMSSHHEGLPLAVVEALALGLPVISTDVGGIAEVVTSGEEGLLSPPGDARALATNLLAVSQDGQRHAQMSESALRRGAALDSTPIFRSQLAEVWKAGGILR